MTAVLEWQAAEGSRTMHVLDASLDGWHAASGRRRRSGPRVLCGRYPQRNAEHPWLAWPADDNAGAASLALFWRLTRCPDCLDRLSSRA